MKVQSRERLSLDPKKKVKSKSKVKTEVISA